VTPEATLALPDAILFDMGGTLVGDERIDAIAGDARLLRHAIDTRGLSAEAVGAEADALSRAVMALRDPCRLELPCRAFQRLLYDRLGIRFRIPPELMELEFWRGAVTHAPEPGIDRLLRRLRDAGVRMGVVSNTMFSAAVLEDDLAHHGLLGYFELVVSSADYGLRKPHPLLFEVALARMGLPAARCWYVGDRPEFDVAGARAAGMTAVWYAAAAAGGETAEPAPDLTVRSWDELGELLAKLGLHAALDS